MRISPNPLNPPSSAPNIATMDRPNVAVKNQQIAAPSSDSVTLSNAFQTGKDNIHSLGILALGGKDELQSWSGNLQALPRPRLKLNIHSLGILALGGKDELQSWSGKGLEIADDTIEMAYNVWNQGFKEAMENQGKPSLVLNRYDIIANSQQVPKWFLQERDLYLNSITDAALKASFEAGAFYHVTGAPDGPYARLLSVYNEVSEN